MDAWPIWIFFAGTIALVMVSIEAGYLLGCVSHRRFPDEKEAPVSAISGAILGLLAFILAFTFGIVTERFDARKALVREEANAIGTTYLRADFLPEPDRDKAAKLLREYVDFRLAAVKSGDLGQMRRAVDSRRIQRELWGMAVANARKDMNSDVAALYIDSLNRMIDLHAMRIAVGLQQRIPLVIWLVLYVLIIFAMLGVGYQTAISGSKKSWVNLILAVSFSIVITMIAVLDQPRSRLIKVSQQPLADLRASMSESAGSA